MVQLSPEVVTIASVIVLQAFASALLLNIRGTVVWIAMARLQAFELLLMI